jgi:hypothetical protein
MSDRIEEIDVQQGIRVAWHKKTQVKEDLSLDDNVLRTWDAVPVPLGIISGGEETGWRVEERIPDLQLVCSDDGSIRLGRPYNPDSYSPLTNEKFLEVIKNAVSGTQHKVVSVGSCRSRGRTFVSLDIEGLGRYDTAGHNFESFLNFGNSFDKSCEFWYNTSNIDTVCDNTFGMNLMKVTNGQGFGESHRHTPGLSLLLPEISRIIDAAVGVQREFAEAFAQLATEKVDKSEAEAVFCGFIADPDSDELSTRGRNITNRLVNLFESSPGCKGETQADMFSAMTYHYTHGTRETLKQFASSEFGFGARRKREFLDVLTVAGYEATKTRGIALLGKN